MAKKFLMLYNSAACYVNGVFTLLFLLEWIDEKSFVIGGYSGLEDGNIWDNRSLWGVTCQPEFCLLCLPSKEITFNRLSAQMLVCCFGFPRHALRLMFQTVMPKCTIDSSIVGLQELLLFSTFAAHNFAVNVVLRVQRAILYHFCRQNNAGQ